MDAHRWKQCVLATAAVVLLTAPVFAQRSVVHTMSAFQVKNETASSQDGFKLTLLGVDPADVIEVGGGTFMQVAGSPGTTVIDWTVSSTAVGATANFAYALAGDVNPTGTTLQWTASGTPTSHTATETSCGTRSSPPAVSAESTRR